VIQDLDCQKAPDTLVGSLNGTYCKRRATIYTFGLSSGVDPALNGTYCKVRATPRTFGLSSGSGTFGFCSGSGSVRVLNPSGFVRG